MSRFTTPSNPITSTQGRLNNSSTDQRRWGASSNAIGRAQTRPSRSMSSRDTVGGTVFTAQRVTATTTATITHPWEVSVARLQDETVEASVVVGVIMDGLLSVTETDGIPDPEEPPVPLLVEAGDVVFIKIEYGDPDLPASPDIFTIEKSTVGDFEKFDDNGDPDFPIVIASRFPLALIEEDTESEAADPLPLVKQLARNNLGLTLICVDGTPVKYLLAL